MISQDSSSPFGWITHYNPLPRSPMGTYQFAQKSVWITWLRIYNECIHFVFGLEYIDFIPNFPLKNWYNICALSIQTGVAKCQQSWSTASAIAVTFNKWFLFPHQREYKHRQILWVYTYLWSRQTMFSCVMPCGYPLQFLTTTLEQTAWDTFPSSTLSPVHIWNIFGNWGLDPESGI